MRRIGDPTFFRLLDRLVDTGNPGRQSDGWKQGDTEWRRDRHSFSGAGYGFSVETLFASRGGRQHWRLMVVKEFWWQGDRGNVVKMSQWAHLCDGSRDHLMDWLQKQGRSDPA